MMHFSLIIPVFNEEQAIEVSYKRIKDALLHSPLSNEKIELIFVNDGSRDKSQELLEGFRSDSTANFNVVILNFSRNFGHSAAVMAGLRHSKGEIVGIIDADMQDPPELLPKMIEMLSSKVDVVYGLRVTRAGETFVKKVTAWMFYRVINVLASIDIPKDTGDFRVMKREVVEALLECKDHTPFMRGLVAWVGFNQVALPYDREERKLGTTKYPFKKMIKFAWQAISSFSNSPLIFIVYLGIIMTLVSILIGAWALIQYFNGNIIPGWTSLLLGFLLGNSATLLMLGIIGLYLGKVIEQVRSRPLYIVKKDD